VTHLIAAEYSKIMVVRCAESELVLDTSQTKSDFYKGFLKAYARYRDKERKKHEAFSKRFIADPDSINW